MTNSYRILLVLQAVVLTVTALYFAQPVLIPLVVAVLLTYLLRPAVASLERRRLPRVPAVVLVVLAILLIMGSVGWIVSRQLYDLALHLDDYRGHVKAKVQWLKESRTHAVDNVRGVITEVTEAFKKEEPETPENQMPANDQPPSQAGQVPTSAATPGGATDRAANGDAKTPEPTPVKIVPEPTTPADALAVALAALSTPLATAAVVAVLVIFMLLSFEEMRNRVLRLAGQSKLTLTTKTLDDVNKRISRYLMMNALVNGSFGLLVFLGLLLIGVDYAALWGFLAAALRFVPYVGPITAATLPIGMSLVQFPGWLHPALVLGWFIVLELITNNVVEPLAYGKSAGVSTVALLVAATFWTWLWGPIGLMLSVPLTVVLAVLGKNIPQFQPLGILLGDEPALDPSASFYQRLLAGDEEEASRLLEEQLANHARTDVYDQLVISALAMAERDRHAGLLDDADKSFVWETARDLIEANAPVDEESAADDALHEETHDHDLGKVLIAACPAQDLADELALVMLSHVAASGDEVLIAPSALMASEKIAGLAQHLPEAVLISALGPGGTSQVRYLCKRIRQEHPALRIIVGRWCYQGDRKQLASRLRSVGADQVVTTLAEALDAIERIQPLPVAV